MKWLYLILRILLAFVFVVSGVDKLHPIFPRPVMPPDAPQTIMFTLLATTGWLKVIGLFELVGGLLVLIGGTVPLGLCILAPITVNIIAVSYLVAGGGKAGIPAIVVTLFELILFWAYRPYFAGILTSKAKPV